MLFLRHWVSSIEHDTNVCGAATRPHIATALVLRLANQIACVPRCVHLVDSAFRTRVGTLLEQNEAQAAAVSSTALVLMGVVHSLLCSNAGVIQLLHKFAGRTI